MPFRLPTFGLAHMVLAVAFLLLGLFLYATVQTAAQSHRLDQARSELEREVGALRAQRAELIGLRRYLESDEYIEAFARRQFGLVRPGEIAVEVQAPEDRAEERSAGERWWQSLFGSDDSR